VPPEPETSDAKPPAEKRNPIDQVNLWIGIIGAVFGIVSLALSIYFYQASKIAPLLTFAVHPLKTELLRPDYDKSLGFTYGGTPIDSESITAVQVSIWNAGTRSIRDTDMLEPFRLVMPDGAPVLRASVKKMSRPICRIESIEDRRDYKSGKCLLRWGILEPGDGAVVQVIYAGGARNDPTIEGIVEGQSEGIQTLRLELGANKKRVSQRFPTIGWTRLLIAFAIALGTMAIIYLVDRRTEPARKIAKAKADAKKRIDELQRELNRNRPTPLKALLLVAFAIFLGSLIALFFVGNISGPPFGW
jgi:hypothetical protein